MSTSIKILALTAVLACLGAVGAFAYHQHHHANAPAAYSMVLLDSGQVFFGKLAHRDTSYPELTEVFYIRTDVDAINKARKTILLKRGDEWHGPRAMTLSRNHIVLIEDVGPGSQVAHLIEQQSRP